MEIVEYARHDARLIAWGHLKPNNLFRSGTVFAILLCLATVQAQVPAYYYQGRHKVQVKVKTDALALDTTAPVSATARGVSAALPAAIVSTPSGPRGKMMVRTKARGLAELTEHARRLRQSMPNARAQAILNAPDASTSAPEKFLTNQISFRLRADSPTAPLASRYGLTNIQPVPYAADTYIATVDTTTDILAALRIANTMQETGDAKWAAPLIEEKKELRSEFNDPLFPNQWHLKNTGSNTINGVAGNDLNVVPAWDFATGEGVNIAIVDEGVEPTHPDLVANVRADLDYDLIDNDDDPSPLSYLSHGVGCAGVAAARGDNGIGVSGVAPKAGIVGLRLIEGTTVDADEATAIAWKATEALIENRVSINNNSWGPTDDGKVLQGPGPLTEAALQYGATEGRDGKGIVYTWAAGNGRAAKDNINKDGYANSPWVIAVGASSSAGLYSAYSEPGSALLVNAPSSQDSDGIVTTNNAGNYRYYFTGTSASAPAVAGVAALMLQINPELTYRDVMHILADTATKNNPADAGWKTNGSGRRFNHDYGFGRVNAFDAVTSAASWQNVPPQVPAIETLTSISVPLVIPDNNTTGVTFTIPVSASPEFVVEHVELETVITHPYRGNLKIDLRSPSGMTSELITKSSDVNADYDHWRFRSVAHWGEAPAGNWQVNIADLTAGNSGSVSAITLRISGYMKSVSGVDDWVLY